jgi:hypothetical protein
MYIFTFHIHLSAVCIMFNKNMSFDFYVLLIAWYIALITVYTLVPSDFSSA